jgi:hypothetical protein
LIGVVASSAKYGIPPDQVRDHADPDRVEDASVQALLDDAGAGHPDDPVARVLARLPHRRLDAFGDEGERGVVPPVTEDLAHAFVDADPVGSLTRDEVLDNVTLTWVTKPGFVRVVSIRRTRSAFSTSRASPSRRP